ncbi:MAG: molecular chaperone HtpG, partial [Coriobacteriaceae bacterium]
MINSIYTNREIFCDSSQRVGRGGQAVLPQPPTFRGCRPRRQPSLWATTATHGHSVRQRHRHDQDDGQEPQHHRPFRFLQFKAAQAEAAAESEPGEAKSLDDLTDVDIISQFGDPPAMVGKKVRVVSRAIGSDETWAWESDGVDGYDIKPAERAEHGTDVIITLKDNTDEDSYDGYLSEYGLKDLVKRYSNYVRYPIKMEVTK